MPDLKVVAERSEQEIKQQHAARAFEWAARELAANLIRIVRGAGKPEQLVQNIDGFIAAFNDYSRVFGGMPGIDVLKEALQYPSHPALSWKNHDLTDELLAEEAICRAALQFVASGLLDQRIHRERATNDLRISMAQWARTQEEGRRRRIAEMKAHSKKLPLDKHRKPPR